MINLSVGTLKTTSETLEFFKNMLEWSQEIQMAYAWGSSANEKAAHWQYFSINKVTKAVIGIHFAQTEPIVLRKLSRTPNILKVIDDTSGVFHPKVIIGIKNGKAKAIIGSSNFTQGGFAGNTEFNISLQGILKSKIFIDIVNFIKDQWNSPRAFIPDNDWIDRYTTAYNKRPKLSRVHSSNNKKVSMLVNSENDINVTWENYYSLVKSQEKRSLSNGYKIHVFEHPERSYIQEIDECQNLFKQHQSFSNIPNDGRKLISGFGGGTSGYLGGMKGAGIFKNIVNQQPNRIGEKLDKIPSEGTVTEKHIIEYLNKMLGITGIDLGSATRLLAVKRPGLFLPVNGGNKPQIRQIFGKAPASVSGYINLINKIWQFPWFGAGIPHSAYEKKIWSYRVAILDAILYEHPVSKKNG